jgi:hypothetical protein
MSSDNEEYNDDVDSCDVSEENSCDGDEEKYEQSFIDDDDDHENNCWLELDAEWVQQDDENDCDMDCETEIDDDSREETEDSESFVETKYCESDTELFAELTEACCAQ